MISNIRSTIDKILNKKILDIMYLIAIFVYSIGKAFRPSALIDIPSKWVYFITVILILPKVLLTKYNKKELLINVLIFGLCFLGYYFYRSRNLIALPFVLVGVKDVDTKKVIGVVFVATMIFVVLHTGAYFFYHFKNGGTFATLPFFEREENRSMVYCKYNNDYGSVCTMAMMQYLYLTNRDKNRFIKFIGLVLLSIFIYAIGTSRTAMIIAILLSLYLLIEHNKYCVKYLKHIKVFTFFAVVILSISMFYMNMESYAVQMLNYVLSGRIYLSSTGYQIVGLSLLPNVTLLLESGLALDNFVVFLFLHYGVLIACGVLGLCMYLCVFRKQKHITDYLAIIMFIWALTERFNYYVTLTVVPMLVMYRFYQVESKNIEK